MKSFKKKNTKNENNIDKYDNELDYVANTNEYASSTELVNYQMEEIEANDNSTMVELKDEQTVQLSLIKENIKDYSEWNKYNREMSFSNMGMNGSNNIHNNKIAASQVSEVVIAILCFFIPPLGVYLYEDSITTNFWVDLIGTLLFWFPGMIFAFLVCFAGLSF